MQPEKGGVFVDCTVGMGGHALALLEAGATKVIGLDRDPAALRIAAETLSKYRDRVELVHSDYRAIASVLEARGIDRVDGTLTDMGMSSYQLEAEGRGFSFQREDPLDMRMDTTTGPTAADLLRGAEERRSRTRSTGLARSDSRGASRAASCRRGQSAPLETTAQLAAIVRRAVPRRGFSRIDPATRTFQALRIWVNRELDDIDEFLRTVARRLKTGARLVAITFHSLEDRIVKHTLRALAPREGGPAADPDEETDHPPGRRARPESARAQREAARRGVRRQQGLTRAEGLVMGTSSEAFEYAIKKDVRNNPIVREVDERRLQEQWRSVAIGVLFVGVLLFSGWQRVELLQHGYRVEQMQKERGDEEEINRHLRLEIETLRSPSASSGWRPDDLQLVAPATGAAIIIERVVPPEPPPASVVAKALE